MIPATITTPAAIPIQLAEKPVSAKESLSRGCLLGDSLVSFDGETLGDCEGLCVGSAVGLCDGSSVGSAVGCSVGDGATASSMTVNSTAMSSC